MHGAPSEAAVQQQQPTEQRKEAACVGLESNGRQLQQEPQPSVRATVDDTAMPLKNSSTAARKPSAIKPAAIKPAGIVKLALKQTAKKDPEQRAEKVSAYQRAMDEYRSVACDTSAVAGRPLVK